MIEVSIDSFIFQNFKTYEEAVVSREKDYREFREDVRIFSELPEVTSNAEELFYIAAFMESFDMNYRMIEILAKMVNMGLPLRKEMFKNAFIETESRYETLHSTIKEAFGQDFYGMVEAAQGQSKPA